MKDINKMPKNWIKKIICYFCILNLVLICQLFGRIGDNITDCAKRYGVAIEESPDGGFIKFEKEGVRVSCVFDEGVCSAISYTLINTEVVIRSELGNEPRFTKDQVFRILNLNRGGSTWSQQSRDSYENNSDGIYRTTDGKLHALVNFVAVNIESIAFYQKKMAKVSTAAVEKTLTSYDVSKADANSPAIQMLPDESKRVDPLEESIKRLEESNEKLKQSTEVQNRAMENLDLIAKRVKKREEMRDMLVKLNALEFEMTTTTTPDSVKLLKEKQDALTAEMTQALKDYEVLDAEFKKMESLDKQPEGN